MRQPGSPTVPIRWRTRLIRTLGQNPNGTPNLLAGGSHGSIVRSAVQDAPVPHPPHRSHSVGVPGPGQRLWSACLNRRSGCGGVPEFPRHAAFAELPVRPPRANRGLPGRPAVDLTIPDWRMSWRRSSPTLSCARWSTRRGRVRAPVPRDRVSAVKTSRPDGESSSDPPPESRDALRRPWMQTFPYV